MKPPVLRRILALIGVSIFLLCAPNGVFAAAPAPAPAFDVVPMGDNTFSITRKATNAFSRDTDRLKELAKADAASYCAANGKQMKVISLTAEKPFFSTGYVSAKIVFMALTSAEIEAAAARTAAGIVEKPTSTEEMYNDLLKLDDLRKKKILTDAEFQTEKKKILNRSK